MAGEDMKLLSHDLAALPLAATGAHGPSAGASWTRALQQAQTWNWFHGAMAPAAAVQAGRVCSMPPSCHGVPSFAVPAVKGPLLSGSLPHLRRPSPAGAVPVASMVHAPAAIDRAAAKDQVPGGAWIAPRSPVVDAEAPPEDPAHRLARALPELHNQDSSDTNMRVHLEAGEGEVSVWLGIDGDPTLVAARACAFFSDLRRDLAFTGHRVAALVCNGRTIDPLGLSPFKELS